MEAKILTTSNEPISLAEFKAYVGESSDYRNDELQIMLNTALLNTEKWDDESLATHTVQLVVDRAKTQIKLPFTPVLSIESVTDFNGNVLSYETDILNMYITLYTASKMIINYTTKSVANDDSKQCILDYATLLYNGSVNMLEFVGVLKKYKNKL